jgi:hypothetical protein
MGEVKIRFQREGDSRVWVHYEDSLKMADLFIGAIKSQGGVTILSKEEAIAE